MEIFTIDESKKEAVYEWVVRKKNAQIEVLVNAFLEQNGEFENVSEIEEVVETP